MMKTYKLCYAFMALLIICCSKSDNETEVGGSTEKGIDSDYTLLVDENGTLSGRLLNANATTIEVGSENSGFDTTTKPQLTFENEGLLSMYLKKSNCSGSVVIHDFKNKASDTYAVFEDIASCDLTANAIAHNGDTIYIAYDMETEAMNNDYFVRVIDISTDVPSPVDVELDQKPVDLAYANNRLFILTIDENSSQDYKLFVIDAATLSIVHEMELGLDVKKIFKNPEGNIIIGYSNLHTTLNSSTMAFAFTNYGENTEPNFFDSRFRHFDTSGKMYYEMPPGSNSIYPVVAAIYDFDKNNTVLYAFENFLTETQRNFEYEIDRTTLVGFDEKNEILLIGYSKSDESGEGGLLRIKIGTEPKLVDNLDLSGIPYALFID